MTFALRALFWTCSFLTGYVYLLYPLLLVPLSKLLGRSFVRDDILPPLSVIITAYNEERSIARKIENTLALDYPRDLMEVIVGSDGSTDGTNEIVRGYEHRGVRLVTFPANRGKTAVQNDCAREASHGLLVFMDAASLCERDCLKKLAANFADRRVGAVAGRIVFTRDRDNLTGQSQGIYWSYEQVLKRAESRLGTLVGVDGPLYAMRRELFEELDEDMMSDFLAPLLVLGKGRCVVYEPQAVTYEEATARTVDELRARRRIVTRGFTALARHLRLVNPLARPLLAWLVISHKVLRWLAGFYYAGMLVTSFFLASSPFFLLAFGGLFSILCLAYVSFLVEGERPKTLAIPYYFMLVNLAAALGVIDCLRGEKVVTWKPVRGVLPGGTP